MMIKPNQEMREKINRIYDFIKSEGFDEISVEGSTGLVDVSSLGHVSEFIVQGKIKIVVELPSSFFVAE